MKTTSQLTHAALADLYAQFDLLQKTGQSILDNLTKTVTPTTRKHIKAVRSHLRRGHSLAEAGRLAGLFIGVDAALMAAGEQRGEYPFAQLAKRHASLMQRQQSRQRKLLLPVTLLALSLLLAPLPELINGSLTLSGYLSRSLGVLVLLGGGLWLLTRLPKLACRFGLGPSLDVLIVQLPIVGNLLKRRALLEFSRALGLLLRAGLPLFEALPVATAVVTHDSLQRRFEEVEQTLRSGSSFAQALAPITELDASLVALAASGEQAGRLDDMLLHYVELEEDKLDTDEAAVIAWFGRSVYLLVVVWIALSLTNAVGSLGHMQPLR